MAEISVRALGPDVLTRARDAQARDGYSRAHTLYTVTPADGGDAFQLTLRGRQRWALDRLRDAGPKGCTPIMEPAGPRWAAYVHDLREMGVEIETCHEPHGGDFPGTHARYVLRAHVERTEVEA
jgi:hypothetical protein